MIISDLSYLEVVSEVSSVVGGVTVDATASAEVVNNKSASKPGQQPKPVAATATSNTNLTVVDKEGKPINLDALFNKVDKLVDKAI